MARKLFEFRATRARAGGLASGIAYIVWDDEAATVLADISASSGGSSIAGSTVTTADIAGLGPSACRFWGPTDDQDTLWVTCPSDASLGVQKVDAQVDARLDALEAGGGGDVAAHSADTTAIHGITDTAQLVKLNATNLYTSAAHNYFRSGRPWYDVRAFGAVGDGTTDDWPSCQAALDACSTAGGGTVYFPPGYYRITQGLTSTASNGIELLGSGGTGQDNTLSGGITQIRVDDSGIWGFTFNPANSSTFFAGPVIRNLHFRDIDGAAGGGIRLLKVNNYYIENVTCSDFVAGTGILSSGSPNQYGTLVECRVGYCLIGLDLASANGTRVLGGMIDLGHNDPAQILANSIGVRVTGGDTNMFMGTVVQMAAKLFQIVSGTYHELHGVRLEGWTTTALEISGDRCSVFGGAIDNSINSGIGTGIDIKAAADATLLFINETGSTATPLTDNGTTTAYLRMNGLFPTLKLGDAHMYRAAAAVMATTALELAEQADAAAPASNNARVYAKDNGSGKTQLVVRFPTGAVQVLATEP